MPSTDRVKDLYDLPATVHKIAFVEQLTRAVGRPAETAATYVATPALVDSFDRGLEFVGAALRSERSHAAFLHGSFGSGKSHFMAMLSLLLAGEEHAWRVPELHALRAKHSFAGTAKLLQLRFHLIGHTGNLESAIFGRYLDAMRELHPEAPVPPLFADKRLFEDARRMLEELGDEKFFAPMNTGSEAAGDWGVHGNTWTRERFDLAARGADPAERAKLFDALVSTRYAAFAQESRQFLDLDEGLAAMSRHAKQSGYAGIVLFLDELILWLASRASHHAWFHNEVQKLVKLVEAQDARRDVPIISFIARQRDLAEMVGEEQAGLEQASVRESLQWARDRFDTISLEDRNLPAIAEKRILRPASPEAKAELDSAFESMRRKLGDAAWQTLLGDLDLAAFRKLYPFSPALVDTLVALSNVLQRERTAIRLLTELMVEHIEDLRVGDIVGVGDLFDVLAGGDEPADGVMRARFTSAKQLYSVQFLPVIQKTHGTDNAEKCQRLRPEHPARIGCSNCPQKACRTDNRLIKSMLLAALVPERPALKNLTASRLVQLNHGSIKSVIPGNEANQVALKLRNWASSGTLAQLHIGSQPDPTVSVQLEGVDTAPILEQAARFDNLGARQKVLRDLLFGELGLDEVDVWGKDHVVEWRGTKRTGHLRFGNVRTMPAEQLVCPEGHDWRLIIDYPFDEEGFGPRDDERVLEEFQRGHTAGTWTVVWLPSFFSGDMQRLLGELVRLNHILSEPATTRQYTSHLSVENQQRARADLENLRAQKRMRVREVLLQAYGFSKPREADIDVAQGAERNLHTLKPGAEVRPQIAAGFADALEKYVEALLDTHYPLHPRFPRKMTTGIAETVVARFGELVDAQDKKLSVDKELRELLVSFAVPLGVIRVTETTAFLRDDDVLQRVENQRVKKALDRPEIADVRAWLDDTGHRGMKIDAQDVILRCYARWSARTFVSGSKPFEPKAGQEIPGSVVLERPDLPSVTEWGKALDQAAELFGISLAGRALHGDNLKRLENAVLQRAAEVAAGAHLIALLDRRLGQFGMPLDTDRAITARSAAKLLTSLKDLHGRALVSALAAHAPERSAKADAQSLAGSADAVAVLREDLVMAPLLQLLGREDEKATGLLEMVRTAFRQDEVHVRLGARIRELAQQALSLVQTVSGKAEAEPPPPGAEQRSLPLKATSKEGALEALAELQRAIDAVPNDATDIRIEGSFKLTWRPKS